jgi:hypothetical protein
MFRNCVVSVLGIALLCAAKGQQSSCAIHTMTEDAAPTYVRMARAAHISGDVVLSTTFDQRGNLENIRAVSGPVMLTSGAIDFVRTWHANQDDDSRSCMVTIHYAISGDTGCEGGPAPTPASEPSGRIDSTHYSIVIPAQLTCDPATTVQKRRRFLGIF